jgi:hypothetical protein
VQSSVLYCKKSYNYLNTKEKNLDIYFQIDLMVNQRSLQREFAIMSFLSLPQSKGVFLRSACDLVTNGCGLPYNNQIIVAIAEQTSIMILCLGQLLTDRQNVIFLYKVCASATSQAFGFRTLPSHTSAMPIS